MKYIRGIAQCGGVLTIEELYQYLFDVGLNKKRALLEEFQQASKLK